MATTTTYPRRAQTGAIRARATGPRPGVHQYRLLAYQALALHSAARRRVG